MWVVLTEDEVPHGVVIGHRPGQRALGEELDDGDRECVHVDLLRESAQAGHELGSLPA